MQPSRVGITVFAVALIGLGAAVSLGSGLGLLWRRTAAAASALAFVYLLLWLVLLRIPAIFIAPRVEVSWAGCGENAIALAGALTLFTALGSGGARWISIARLASAMVTGMMAAFTLLVWLSGAISTPHSRFQWTALFVSTLLTGGAWVVAETYRGVPWRAVRVVAEPTLGQPGGRALRW